MEFNIPENQDFSLLSNKIKKKIHDLPKTCTKCKQLKDSEEFYVKDKKTGRRMSWCRTCHAEITDSAKKSHYQKNAESLRASKRAKYAADPEKYKQEQLQRYWEDPEKSREKARNYASTPNAKATVAAYNEANKEKVQERRAKYRRENREKIREANRLYRLAHPDQVKEWKKEFAETHPEEWAAMCARAKHRRRDRHRNTECTLTGPEWKAILVLQGYKCACCKEPFGPNLKPFKDHIKPLLDGGGLTYKNVQALCRKCNCQKYVDDTDYRDFTPEDVEMILASGTSSPTPKPQPRPNQSMANFDEMPSDLA